MSDVFELGPKEITVFQKQGLTTKHEAKAESSVEHIGRTQN